jgi:lysozyme family protein
MKVISWLKNKFRRVPVAQKPVPVIVTPITGNPPLKSELIQVIDLVNNGNASKPDWTYLITTCRIDIDKTSIVKSIIRDQKYYWSIYSAVSSATGVPADVIANIHYKECSGDFKKGLHCGDPWNKKTVNVPKGHGPFVSWEAAAIHALLLKKNLFPKIWTSVEKLIFLQRYNGLGHQNKGLEYTPYIWAYTSHHDETGNYIADGKYSHTAAIRSPGCMALMIAQEEAGLT